MARASTIAWWASNGKAHTAQHTVFEYRAIGKGPQKLTIMQYNNKLNLIDFESDEGSRSGPHGHAHIWGIRKQHMMLVFNPRGASYHPHIVMLKKMCPDTYVSTTHEGVLMRCLASFRAPLALEWKKYINIEFVVEHNDTPSDNVMEFHLEGLDQTTIKDKVAVQFEVREYSTANSIKKHVANCIATIYGPVAGQKVKSMSLEVHAADGTKLHWHEDLNALAHILSAGTTVTVSPTTKTKNTDTTKTQHVAKDTDRVLEALFPDRHKKNKKEEKKVFLTPTINISVPKTPTNVDRKLEHLSDCATRRELSQWDVLEPGDIC